MTASVTIKVYTTDGNIFQIDGWSSMEGGRAVAMDIRTQGYRVNTQTTWTLYPPTSVLKVEVYEERREPPVSAPEPKASTTKPAGKGRRTRSSKRPV